MQYLIKRFNKKKYIDPSLNKNCTEFEVNNWTISEFILDRLIPLVGIRPFPLEELQLMVSTVCQLRPDYIFEWGTHIGKSARIFYETTKTFGVNSYIYSIDLPDNAEHVEHPGNLRGQMVKNLKNVILLQGDGVLEALKIYKKANPIKPLFFLDGDHEYKSVKRELSLINNSAPNTSILVHDTFYQSKKSGYNIGPFKAVKEFLKNNPEYSSISTQLGLPGITLLYKK
jgi:cephalosporin hydroxylase